MARCAAWAFGPLPSHRSLRCLIDTQCLRACYSNASPYRCSETFSHSAMSSIPPASGSDLYKTRAALDELCGVPHPSQRRYTGEQIRCHRGCCALLLISRTGNVPCGHRSNRGRLLGCYGALRLLCVGSSGWDAWNPDPSKSQLLAQHPSNLDRYLWITPGNWGLSWAASAHLLQKQIDVRVPHALDENTRRTLTKFLDHEKKGNTSKKTGKRRKREDHDHDDVETVGPKR
ncbi:hypothetical protein C8R44DRAFT_210885 [Mycena epipterygia]|nr:hypothetical protein C8R44DRAFT_210885 [Mycena epipterygia]